MSNIKFYDSIIKEVDGKIESVNNGNLVREKDVYNIIEAIFGLDINRYKRDLVTNENIQSTEWRANLKKRCDFYNEYFFLKSRYNSIHTAILNSDDEKEIEHLKNKASILGQYLEMLEHDAKTKGYKDIIDFNYNNLSYKWYYLLKLK